MSTMRIINYSANIKELLLIHRNKNWLSLNGNFVADFFTILAGLNVFKEGGIKLSTISRISNFFVDDYVTQGRNDIEKQIKEHDKKKHCYSFPNTLSHCFYLHSVSAHFKQPQYEWKTPANKSAFDVQENRRKK